MFTRCIVMLYHLVDFDKGYVVVVVVDFDTKRTFSVEEKFVAEAEENLHVLDL